MKIEWNPMSMKPAQPAVEVLIKTKSNGYFIGRYVRDGELETCHEFPYGDYNETDDTYYCPEGWYIKNVSPDLYTWEHHPYDDIVGWVDITHVMMIQTMTDRCDRCGKFASEDQVKYMIGRNGKCIERVCPKC